VRDGAYVRAVGLDADGDGDPDRIEDAQIAALHREMEAQRAVMMAEIETLGADRNYFREIVVRQQARERRSARGVEPESA
jgi:hypothetical protein